jgi:hypothetical protein
VRADPAARDSALDRLAGVRGDVEADSSSRFDGLPRHRASGALDGGPRAWIGQWIPGRPAWLEVRAARELALRELRLEPVAARVRRPTRVRVDADGVRGPQAPVAADGRVVLPRTVRGRAFRVHVLDAAFPPGTPPRAMRRRAVGIGELRARGIGRLRVPRAGTVRVPCGPSRWTCAARAPARPPGSCGWSCGRTCGAWTPAGSSGPRRAQGPSPCRPGRST